MANIEKIKVGSTTYDIRDATAPHELTDIALAGENVTFTPPPFGELNVTVVGSPTISSSFVASGFSDSSYLTTSNILNNASSSFELVTAINMTTASNNNLGIFDTSGVSTHNIRFTTSSTNTLHLRISTSGGETYPIDITGTTPLTVGTKFWCKVTYSSLTGYALYISTDGETWTPEGTSSTTTRPYSSANSEIVIGDNVASGLTLTGSIYLQDTYINVNNGEYEWHAVNTTTDKTKIDVSVPAGVLTNSATGANSLSILGTATGTYSLSMLGNAMSYNSAVALGSGARCQANHAIAVGASARAVGAYSTYIGSQNNVNYYAGGDYSICIGYNSSTNPGHYGIAIGASSYAGGYGVSLGSNAKTGNSAIAIGYYTQATSNYSVAIGYNAFSTQTYAIQLGTGTNNTANTFSVGLSNNNNYRLLDSDGIIPFARQAKVITEGASDPDTTTVGTVGLLYRNTTDGGIFKCTDTTGSVYTWVELGAASYDSTTQTITL